MSHPVVPTNKGLSVSHRFSTLRPLLVLGVAAIALAGCDRNPLIVKRSPCPAVAAPFYTNDLTLFYPGTAPDAANVDLVATITNVRESCVEGDAQLTGSARYDVIARRTATAGPRSLAMPVFASVVQGGNLVVSKQVGQVKLEFPTGQARAQASGSATAVVSRAAASIPAEIQQIINRKRKPGDPDAAVDPLADPQVRAALRAATFERLVGFQLSEAQLAYNVTK
ncbi:hypothetical protein GCM10007973_03650 [Polymorphobacter multimanifer]|nr:hypothetical protein GCM10007973_03650 [Polymorphobacter multimanifer]